MSTQGRLAVAAVIFSFTGALGFAQSVTSAHSGTVHYFDGDVSIDGAPVQAKVSKFSELKENGVLHTGLGRAEILLTPGVFLRVGENTSIKMLDNRLLSTRVELLSGSVIVESDDPEVSVKDPAVTILYKTYDIQPLKYGVFEISSEPGQMKVFKGQATVVAGNERTTVKDGHMLTFSAALVTEKFDEKQADDLYLWTRDRSASLSAANMSAANRVASNGGLFNNLFTGGYPGLGISNQFQGMWYYSQGLGMYTYLPYGGTAWSPFGYSFYSPYTIYSYYSPYNNYYWNGGGGSRTGSSSGTSVSSPTLAASQIGRLGTGSVHSAVIAPSRSTAPAAGTGAFRGGFDPNAGFSSSNNASSSGGFATSTASAGSGLSSPAASSVSAGRSSAGAASVGGSRGR